MLRLPCSSNTQATRGTDFAAVNSLGNGALKTCSNEKGCWAVAPGGFNHAVMPRHSHAAMNTERVSARIRIVLLQSPGCCAVVFSRETFGSVSGPEIVRKR